MTATIDYGGHTYPNTDAGRNQLRQDAANNVVPSGPGGSGVERAIQGAGPGPGGAAGPPGTPTAPGAPPPANPGGMSDADRARLAAYYNAVSGFDYDQLHQNNDQFNATLAFQREQMERLGIPQLQINQQLANMEDQHFQQQLQLSTRQQGFTEEMGRAGLGQQYLSQAAQFAASDPFALSDYMRGAQSNGAPRFVSALMRNVGGGGQQMGGASGTPQNAVRMGDMANAMGGGGNPQAGAPSWQSGSGGSAGSGAVGPGGTGTGNGGDTTMPAGGGGFGQFSPAGFSTPGGAAGAQADQSRPTGTGSATWQSAYGTGPFPTSAASAGAGVGPALSPMAAGSATGDQSFQLSAGGQGSAIGPGGGGGPGGGMGTGIGPSGFGQTDAALAGIRGIYSRGAHSLAAGSLEGLDSNENNLLNLGIGHAYGSAAAPAFMQQYYRNPIRQQAASQGTTFGF